MRPRPRVLLLPTLIGVGAFVTGACADDPPRRQPKREASDKAALYGDAALLPTRAGERARNEVALAQEVRAALETLHAVESARVTVASDPRGAPGSAAIVIRARAQTDPIALEATVVRLSRAALGAPELPIEIEVSAPTIDEAVGPRDDDDRPSGPLLFGVLGLGISLGLTFDRAVGIVRRRRGR